MQFINWPHKASSKNGSTNLNLHVKLPNFTSKIYIYSFYKMDLVCTHNFSIFVLIDMCEDAWSDLNTR